VAQVLDERLEKAEFDRLVLVAAPVTLGDLRAMISKRVAAVVVGEIPRGLTKMPNADVAPHLKDILVL
jgi:protein required for attachment to host cells